LRAINKDIFINEILEKYGNISGFKYIIGSKGIHTEFPTGIVGVTQYNYYKFEEK